MAQPTGRTYLDVARSQATTSTTPGPTQVLVGVTPIDQQQRERAAQHLKCIGPAVVAAKTAPAPVYWYDDWELEDTR
jgi:hypothetical protein